MKKHLHKLWTRISKKALEQDIREMEEKIQEQKKEFFQLKDTDEFLQSDSDLGSYRQYLFCRMPLHYLDSVFMTRREKLIPKITATFEPSIIRHISEVLSEKDMTHIFTMALYCQNIIPGKTGIRLVLEDPYRTIRTQPLNLTQNDAESLIGLVILAKVALNGNSYNPNIKDFQISAIQKTVYTLDGEYKNGSFQPIPVDTDRNRYYLLRNIRGVEECRTKLDAMETELERHGNRIETYAFRKTKDVLYIRRHGALDILYQSNGRLEYAFELQTKNYAQEVSDFFAMSKGLHLGEDGLEWNIFDPDRSNLYIKIMDSTFERDILSAT